MARSTKRDIHRRVLKARRAPCAICGQPIDYALKTPDPGSFEVDHILPLAKGGEDALANTQSAHRACNRAKSDSIDYDPVTKQGVVLKRVRAW